jgi:signal transduction histidine kinase
VKALPQVRDRLVTRPWLVDGIVAALLLVLFVLQVTGAGAPEPGQRRTDLLAVLLFLVMIGSYLLHRRYPPAAAAVALSALLIQALTHGQAYPGVNAFVLLFGIALHCNDRRHRIAIFVATLSCLTVAVWVQPAGVATTSTWISTLLLATVAGLSGENLRHRRARWAALEERARLLESEREERARRAVVDERLRIARELHDVVAHSMSVIAVQAGVGHHVLDSQPEEARRALAAIETTSRAALTEMRRLLGVLRQEGQPRAELSPAPGLADLPQLLTQVREAGLEVTSTVTGEPVDAATPVGLTAYRIVQEALTNVLKHGGPRATVTIEYCPDEVRLEIADDGRSRPGPNRRQRTEGHGLIGMRERVAVFGGRLSAGSQPGGGFRVAARLPMTREP